MYNLPPDDARDQVMDRLVEQDRVLLEARMLPRDRKLTAEEINSVRSRVRALLDQGEGEVSMATIASQIGYAPSTMNQWLHDRYKGKVDEVTHAVNLWLERHVRREHSRTRREYVQTWVCDEMAAVIRFAHRRERMAAIVAPSGSGKDMVIDVLCDDLNGYVVHCHQKLTPNELLVEILHQLDHRGRRHQNAASMVRQVVKLLRDKACTLFLNEAQQLPTACASVIRTIHDQTAVPIIMLGSHEIFDFIDDRANGGGQFARRCIKCNIESKMAREADPDDPGQVGRPLYSKDEVRRFLASKRIRLADEGTFTMLWQIACMTGYGTLGLVNEIVEGAADLSGDEPLTEQMVTYMLHLQLENDAEMIMANLPEPVAETAGQAVA